MIIDTHCHLDFHDNPIEFAKKYESLGYIIIGVTNLPSYFEQGIQHLSGYKKIRLALGLHPLLTEKHTKQELKKFEILSNQTSYIGEVGLDFSREGYATKEKQLASFQFILEVLANSNKLITLHSRRAEKEVLQQLIRYNIKNAIFHWYSGALSLVDDIAAAGFYFSVNPAMVVSPNGKKIIDRIPLQNILTETDAPYSEVEGKTVRPEDIEDVFNYLATTRNLTQSQVEEIIKHNFFESIRTLSTTR